MARNTQIKPRERFEERRYEGVHSYRSPSSVDPQSSRGKMKFTLKQLLLFWSVTIIMMLIVFVSGYRAGKIQGGREILDQVDRQMVRLPIPRPHGYVNETDNKNASEEKDTSQENATLEKPPKEDRKIDFTKKDRLNSSADLDPKLPEVKSRDTENKSLQERFEEVYPGRKLFSPPSGKDDNKKSKEEETAAVVVSDVKIEPTATPAEPKLPSMDDLEPESGWYVQVAAASSKDDAFKIYKRLSSGDFETRIEKAPIRDRTYYRILVGPYGERKEALSKRGQAKNASGVSGEPFIRVVK